MRKLGQAAIQQIDLMSPEEYLTLHIAELS